MNGTNQLRLEGEVKTEQRKTREVERNEARSVARWRTATMFAAFALAFVGGMQFPTANAWLTGGAAVVIGALLLIASLWEAAPEEFEVD